MNGNYINPVNSLFYHILLEGYYPASGFGLQLMPVEITMSNLPLGGSPDSYVHDSNSTEENDAVFSVEMRSPASDIQKRPMICDGVEEILMRARERLGAPYINPSGYEPRVEAAVKDMELTPEAQEVEDENRKKDKPTGYSQDRGLDEINLLSIMTRMGRIDDKIRQRIGEMRLDGYVEPLDILIIGPGLGLLEGILASIFGPEIMLDAFTLTDNVSRLFRHVFSTIYIGNIDSHRLPNGYDLVISSFGSYHAYDQIRVLDQIVGSLNPGGEAFFMHTVDFADRPNLIFDYDQIVLLRDKYGIILDEEYGPPELVYVYKERDIPDFDEFILDLRRRDETRRGAP